jgi:catabolite regulation protein CreA
VNTTLCGPNLYLACGDSKAFIAHIIKMKVVELRTMVLHAAHEPEFSNDPDLHYSTCHSARYKPSLLKVNTRMGSSSTDKEADLSCVAMGIGESDISTNKLVCHSVKPWPETLSQILLVAMSKVSRVFDLSKARLTYVIS